MQEKSKSLKEKLYCEDFRLQTFNDWPLKDLQKSNKEKLAKTGFYFTEDPIVLHFNSCSSCPLIRRQKTKNVPINEKELDEILPEKFYDVCGTGVSFKAKYPDFESSSSRSRSFSNWPVEFLQPGELVDAGLFYLGNQDRVACFCCGVGLKDWEEGDCPIQEHARHTSNCEFINYEKGPKYIAAVKKKFGE